jgi:hypothetical protein
LAETKDSSGSGRSDGRIKEGRRAQRRRGVGPEAKR